MGEKREGCGEAGVRDVGKEKGGAWVKEKKGRGAENRGVMGRKGKESVKEEEGGLGRKREGA